MLGPEPRHLWSMAANAYSPRASVLAGKTSLAFHLTPRGAVVRQRAGARNRADLETIGDIGAESLLAVGRSDGGADLVALRRDGAMLFARAGRDPGVSWRELGAKIVGEPAVVRAPGGALHVFGLDPEGSLLHAELADKNPGAPRWDRWEKGFTGRVSCAGNDKGEAHLFARRESGVAHARLSLESGEIPPLRFEVMEAPFHGPAMVGATGDGEFAALGCDDEQIFWVKAWDGERWKPEGRDWERAGTIDDVLRSDESSSAEG